MRAAEVLASRILFWGGVLSIVIMTLGIVGFVWAGGPPPPRVLRSVGEVARALSRWPVDPLAIVATGILFLLATPVLAVGAMFGVFAGGGDRRYAAITAGLLAALLVSLVFVRGK
jgi:uncharacterized membrane protein